MGNYRFKFSDMIPNAWFYKLKDFTKQPTRNFTKKKLHHNSSLVSNPVPLNSPPHTTSPSSSSRDKQSQYQRKSYYFTRDVNQPASPPIHDASSYHRNGRHGHGSIYKEADGIVLQPPRRSSKKRRNTRRSRASPRLVTSSIPAGYSCRSTIESVKTNNHPDSTSQEYPNSAADTSSETESILQPIRVVATGVTTSTDSTMLSSCTWSSRLEDDIINNLKSRPPAKQFVEHVDDKRNPSFDSVSNIELPSIKTKGIDIINKESEPTIIRMRPMKFGNRNGYGSLPDSMKMIVKKDEKSSPQVKRFSVSSHSPGVKLRTNSPRIVTRRIHGRKSISPRRSLSESFAVVKSSKDPEKDFRDSMVEMIVEHNIWSSKELEDLLTCYLSLNSYKYHDIIIRVFKQIWFEFVHTE